MESIKSFLTRKLKLKVNPEKSAVGKPSRRKFLGFSFQVAKSMVKRRLAPKTIARYKERIREITGRNRGISLNKMTGELARFINGWRGYFGFCETPSVLRRLEQGTRRRFRLVAWKQWKTGRRRFTELARRGPPCPRRSRGRIKPGAVAYQPIASFAKSRSTTTPSPSWDSLHSSNPLPSA